MSQAVLCGYELRNPFLNASGLFSDSPALLKEWVRAGVGAVITKSITLNEKKSNPFNYFKTPPELILIKGSDYTINSMGLPNKGFMWWKKELSKTSFSIPLVVSVATGTGDLSEYSKIINELEPFASIFDVNVSCPNTSNRIIGYDLESLSEVLSSINTDKPFSVKLPCYYDKNSLKDVILDFDEVGMHFLKEKAVVQVPEEINEDELISVLDLLDDYGVKCVTSHNTFPVSHPLLSMPRGGLSGRPIHDISVKQAGFISEHSSLEIIASGGILNPNDASDFLSISNVRAVLLGSGYFQYDSVKSFVFEFIKKASQLI